MKYCCYDCYEDAMPYIKSFMSAIYITYEFQRIQKIYILKRNLVFIVNQNKVF